MLDPRGRRIAGLSTLGAILIAAVAAKGCSSEPKRPEPPPKTSPPVTAKGDTTPAKPGDKTAPAAKPGEKKGTEVAKAPTPAPAPRTEPKPEPRKPTPAPAPRAEPKPEPAPIREGEPAPPPKPPVNIPPPPPSNEPLEDELEGKKPAKPVEPPAKPTPPAPKPVEPPKEPVKKPTEKPVAPPVKKPAEQPAAKPVPPPPAKKAEDGTKPAPKVLTPEEMQARESEKLLKALSEEKRIELEKRRFLADEYAKRGEEAFGALKFEDAKEWALKALEQVGTHAGARDLLTRSRSALGERAGEVRDVTDELIRERQVKMEMMEAKVKAYMDAGRTAMSRGDYQGAIDNFENALVVMRQDPYGITWGDRRSNAEARLKDARDALEKATEEERRLAAQAAYKKVKEEELERRLAEAQKWQALMNEAIAAYERGDFARSEELARQALDIQPDNTRARDLLAAANRARHGQTTEATRVREKEEFRKWKLEMLDSTIPRSRVVEGPSAEYWDRITRLRKGLGQDTTMAAESPEASALRNRLAEEMTSFSFDGQTLSEAVNYLTARHNINIVIDEQVRADADAQPLPSLKLTNIPLKTGINVLLDNVQGLTYRIRGNMVFITKPELAREAPVVKIHPVGDLTMKINNFVAPNLILKPAGAEADESAPTFGKMEEGIPSYGAAEDIIQLIRDNVGDTPEVWNAEGVSLDASGDSNILVVAEPALQDATARFLNDLRKFSGLVVNIETRFLSVSDNFLRDVGVDVRGLGGQKGLNATLDDVTNGLEDGASQGLDNSGIGVPANASGRPSSGAFFNDFGDGDYRGRTEHIFDRSLATTLSSTGGAILQWTLIDDTQLSLIWRAVQKKQEARVLQSPNLTVYNTQRANIALINQLAFVQDFDVEVAQTAFIADPIVSIIQDGLALDVKPVVSNDRRYVTLQLQPTIATLTRPIQTFTTSLGAFTTPVTLQLPEINIQKAQTTVRVPNGGTLLIGGLKNISMVDLKSETPWLSKIPIVSFFFSRRANAQEFNNLLIIIKARITDLSEEEKMYGSR